MVPWRGDHDRHAVVAGSREKMLADPLDELLLVWVEHNSMLVAAGFKDLGPGSHGVPHLNAQSKSSSHSTRRAIPPRGRVGAAGGCGLPGMHEIAGSCPRHPSPRHTRRAANLKFW